MGNGPDRRHNRQQPLMSPLRPRRVRTEWRAETGSEYDLRQYVGGRPTGIVAAISWRPDPDGARRQTASGPDGWLIREPNRLVLVERHGRGETAVRMRIPLRSCAAIKLDDEPGLPGRSLVRCAITARFGTGTTFTVTLWFPYEDRHVLIGIAREVNGRGAPPSPVARQDSLPLLGVRQAPDDQDWIAFRPGPCSDEVLRPDRDESP